MERLFVALRPPLAVRRQLLALMHGITAVRWQDDDQLHLTLRFIGGADRRQADDIADALLSVDRPCPMLACAGTNIFARKGVPHSLWAGIAPDDALTSLQHKVERALVRVGIAPCVRKFVPHITLARLNRVSGSPDAFLANTTTLRTEPVRLDAFLLYESILSPDGATYQVLARYPLDDRRQPESPNATGDRTNG